MGTPMIRIILSLILLAVPVHAGPDRISFLLGSEHFGATSDFQEFNPGAFFTWDRGNEYSLGAFYNSYADISVAGTVGWPVWRFDQGQVNLLTGIAWYPGDGRRFGVHVGDFVPLLGVQARYGNGFAQIIPSDGVAVDAIFAAGLTFELKKP